MLITYIYYIYEIYTCTEKTDEVLIVGFKVFLLII